MNSKVTESPICMGCLSVDRKLNLLSEECKQTYCRFLESNQSQQISLCFECIALLQRTERFKKQVKQAYKFFISYLDDHKARKTLSKLAPKNIVQFDNISNKYTDNKFEVIYPEIKNITQPNVISNAFLNICDTVKHENSLDQKRTQYDQETCNYDQETSNYNHETCNYDQETNSYDQETNSYDQETNSYDWERSNYDQKTFKNQQNLAEPLAFIKVEDLSEGDLNGGFDDQDLKDTGCEESVYLDSDDEPLKLKSKKNKEKKTIKKIKHEPPTKRKRGREQPSGVVNDPRVAKKLRDLNIGPGHIALVMLTWDEVEEERRASLRSVQFTRHAHRCTHCVVGYNHSHKLTEHNLKHSSDAGSEICNICTIRCKTPAALASHKRRHRARWVCEYCSARFSQASVAADHCAREHDAPCATHRCPHCHHTATSLGALRMHMKGHMSRPECSLCGKTFRDKSSLKTHAFVHRGEKEHACSVCDKKFMFKKQKEIHEITHMNYQYLYCHQCDVSFKNQTSYYQHIKYNLKHIDPADIKHACKICDKRFVKAKRLEEHNLAVHLKLAPIKCTVADCTFACPSRAALRSHTRLLHRGARALTTHVCHLCGHTYKSKKSLEGHLRSHNTVSRQTTKDAAMDVPA